MESHDGYYDLRSLLKIILQLEKPDLVMGEYSRKIWRSLKILFTNTK
jgi:hypothetical protein